MAARCASDQRQTLLERGFGGRGAVERNAEQPETAGVRVDDRHAHRRARGEPELFGGLGRQPADLLAHRANDLSDSREA